jgi:hypothetical protein
MSEYFLHYIWQFQYFDKFDLLTSEGEEVKVFHAGHRNIHSGPDFYNAHLRIGPMDWIGSVEIHINASGWVDHHHNTDPAYENVVLHVVWKNDKPVYRNDGSLLPVIELKGRVAEELLLQMKTLVNSPEQIPCSHSFSKVSSLNVISALDRVMIERLEARSRIVLDRLQRNNNDWEETCYQLLCRNFGFKVNADPFQQLSTSLQLRILLKHGDKLLHAEALLFGMAGFLDEELDDEYHQLLRREFKLLSVKYGLIEKQMQKSQWRFLRLRPGNFPTIRIAQIASVFFHQKNLFSKIIAIPSARELNGLFSSAQSSYWTHHYRFSKESKDVVPPLGESSIDNILINTVVPLLAAYSQWKDDHHYLERAIRILHEISPEQNAITKLWSEPGMKSKSAFDSQALIELYSSYCQKRRCLECKIGSSLLTTFAQ